MNSTILKQLFDVYNKLGDWQIIIDNSDQLNNLSLVNKNKNYKLSFDNSKLWSIIDENHKVLHDNCATILEIVNNLNEDNNNKELELIGFCVKNISSRKKRVYVPVNNKLISFSDWKKQKIYRWWIPIYLNFSHFKQSRPILERTISSMAGEFDFKPQYVIDILSKLLIRTYSSNILSEVKAIINYYLNEYSYLNSNIRYSIKSFELIPQKRREINDLLQFLVKSIIICECSRSFLIKFWTEFLARKIQYMYSNLGNNTFKMFYKHWHIDLNLMNKYLLPSVISVDKLIRFLYKKDVIEYNRLRDWLADYPYKMQYDSSDDDDCVQKFLRYICIISFKQGYIPFNANHFNNQKKIQN